MEGKMKSKLQQSQPSKTDAVSSLGPSRNLNVRKKYCIIGAGFCGLGVAKTLNDYGISFDWFERESDLGGNWLNGVYDSTHIISSRDTTGFSDFPMPRTYPDFPSRRQMWDYLNSYAERFGLKKQIQFNTEITEVTALDETGLSGWRVRTRNGVEREYSGVIVCNGHHWDKRFPQYPGNFSGKVLHSKDYKNSSDFEGRSVLVVGAGNSGCDIAVEAALGGKKSAISMRRGYYFIPKTICGIPMAEIDRPWLPVWSQKKIIKLALKLLNGSNSRYGLEEPDHEIFEHHPIINSQLMYFIRHGRIAPKRDIKNFEGKIVNFVDGSHLEVDTLVYATGYNVSFPFLAPEVFNWDNGVPERVAGMLAPNKAGLYIFGLGQPRGGAGPLISEGSKVLAEMILIQEGMDHPIAQDLARVSRPTARMLYGVSESMRQIRWGRIYLRRLSRKFKVELPKPRAKALKIKPRNPKFGFSEEQIPKYWFKNSPLATHLVNSLNLLFPEGERMFIRAVKEFSGEIQDQELKEQMQGFMAQEVQHGREHEMFFETLRAQGFEIDDFLKWYKWLSFDVIERKLSKKMRLSWTAALEHYTAVFAEWALGESYLRQGAHPIIGDLLRWHAAEEIEHRTVAFDVLDAVAPGYFLRISGMALASMSLGFFWMAGVRHLFKQDNEARLSLEQLRELYKNFVGRGYLLKAYLQYLRPGFHPSQVNNEDLARAAIQEIEAHRKYFRSGQNRETKKEFNPGIAPPFQYEGSQHL